MKKLSEGYFGDYEAQDEAIVEEGFFINTFVLPNEITPSILNNKRKSIIVGRKGSGKTTLQIYLSKQLENEGYKAKFFSFLKDVEPRDYSSISQTQSFSILALENNKNVFMHYDYRAVWRRTFLNLIAQRYLEAGEENDFTKFVVGKKGFIKNIFDGITKTLTVKLEADIFNYLKGEINFDPSQINVNGEISVDEFNRISMDLLLKIYKKDKFYLFVDELSFSRLDLKEDEINAKSAMVRDILRVANEFNMIFVKNKVDFHVIASIRPEVKELLIDNDSEIGKLFSKEIDLKWNIPVNPQEDFPLMEVLRNKVCFGFDDGRSFSEIFTCENITFNENSLSIREFVKRNTWGRPRDIVRLLNSIQASNGNSYIIDEPILKKALERYAKESLKEICDELSVRGGRKIANSIRNGVNKRQYDSEQELWDAINSRGDIQFSKSIIMSELYTTGFIGNKDGAKFYWFYRDGSRYRPDMNIIIHPGLWKELRT